MFSKKDAEQLRKNLPKIKFLSDGGEPVAVLDATASDLYVNYCKHYGLDFCSGDAHPTLQTATSNIGTLVSGSYELVCQQFLPLNRKPLKTVFVLHGYFDHAGLYTPLIKHLIESNVAVVTLDLPGHGLSSGEAASINTFRQYSDAFLACLQTATRQGVAGPWVALGQSTGAAIIIDALLDKDLSREFSFESYVLLGPLLKPKNWLWSQLLFSCIRWFVASMPRMFSANSHDAEFLHFLQYSDHLQSRRIPRDWILAMIDYYRRFDKAPPLDQKLEIIQGTDDGTVDWKKNIPKIVAKFTGSEVYEVKGARHHLVKESVPYRMQVFQFISQILGLESN